jgi:hypothetical protein
LPAKVPREPGTRWVIDATRSTDGFARYCNDFSLGLHSRRRLCTCVFRRGVDCIPEQDKFWVFLEANTAIDAGTELSVSYGTTYWTEEMRESAQTTCMGHVLSLRLLWCTH